MNPAEHVPPTDSGDGSPGSVRWLFWDAVSFWERRRIGYNAALALVVLAWLVFTWPHFRPALNLRSGILLLVLASLANVCYFAAYPVDIVFQLAYRSSWRRRRWMLWWAGIALAVAFACYWIGDEIYPGVGG
jgi:hypothetical protein